MIKGRGIARSVCGRRHLYSPEDIESTRTSMGSEHEAGRQVFRHTLVTWIREAYGIDL